MRRKYEQKKKTNENINKNLYVNRERGTIDLIFVVLDVQPLTTIENKINTEKLTHTHTHNTLKKQKTVNINIYYRI